MHLYHECLHCNTMSSEENKSWITDVTRADLPCSEYRSFRKVDILYLGENFIQKRSWPEVEWQKLIVVYLKQFRFILTTIFQEGGAASNHLIRLFLQFLRCRHVRNYSQILTCQTSSESLNVCSASSEQSVFLWSSRMFKVCCLTGHTIVDWRSIKGLCEKRASEAA